MRCEASRAVAAAASAFVLAAALGCSARHPAASAEARSDGLVARCELDPAVAGEDNTLRVSIRDSGGNPVFGARVTLDAAMPDMDMRARAIAAAPSDDGSYEAGHVRFSMAGEWVVMVSVRTPGGALVRIPLRLTVEE